MTIHYAIPEADRTLCSMYELEELSETEKTDNISIVTCRICKDLAEHLENVKGQTVHKQRWGRRKSARAKRNKKKPGDVGFYEEDDE